jgi:hypothetical protein
MNELLLSMSYISLVGHGLGQPSDELETSETGS